LKSEAQEIIGIYQRHARAWAGDRNKSLFEKAWLDRFIAPLPLKPRVLDIGCGCAEPIGRYLIKNECTVTGVDSSPELIAMCRERFPDHDWRVGDMRELLHGQTFDGVLAWDSFFHLCPEDQRKMFARFQALTALGGTLMFTSGLSCGVAMGTYRGEPLYHASLDTSEYQSLLEASGFEVLEHVLEDPTCGRHTVWLSRRR
jgi:trans-aconitate methyltransferase